MASTFSYTAVFPDHRSQSKKTATLLTVVEPDSDEVVVLEPVMGGGLVARYLGPGEGGDYVYEVIVDGASQAALMTVVRAWKALKATTGTVEWVQADDSGSRTMMTLASVAERKVNRYKRRLTLTFKKTTAVYG
ncbi:MAG: hypothetical protein GHCLOJNM_01566 [bacterium]|nr:hypothetical protein [bacterium]